jgi:hypothetical protein
MRTDSKCMCPRLLCSAGILDSMRPICAEDQFEVRLFAVLEDRHVHQLQGVCEAGVVVFRLRQLRNLVQIAQRLSLRGISQLIREACCARPDA